jgi:hypothetical protein
MLVAYFEVAMGPEDNKPIRVASILGTKNLSPYYIERPRVLPPVGGWSLVGGEGACSLVKGHLTNLVICLVKFCAIEPKRAQIPFWGPY